MDERLKDYLEQLELPGNQLEQAIQRAVAQNKREKKSKKVWITSFITVAAICVLLLSIRVSPTIAYAMAKVPGLETLVQLIQHDKGIEDILNEGYSEKIGVTVEQDGITITIDEVIADESGMIVAYEINSEQNLNQYEDIQIEVLQNNELIKASYSYSTFRGEGEVVHQYAQSIDIVAFEHKMDYTNPNFAIRFKFNELQIEAPFHLENEIELGQVYEINKQLQIDGQKFTVEQMKITPLRTSISISIDPSNSKRILDFGSLSLIDEKGEIWSNVRNGISAMGSTFDQQITYYLQSNYFRKPKSLTLQIDEVTALPKGQDFILVDLEKEELIFAPTHPNLIGIDISADAIVGKYKPIDSNNYINLFGQHAVDANGHKVEIYAQGGLSDLEVSDSKARLELEGHQNPIKIYFDGFPNQLEGSAKVKVPLK